MRRICRRESFPEVSLDTYKFKFVANTANKQALKGDGLQFYHFFFTPAHPHHDGNKETNDLVQDKASFYHLIYIKEHLSQVKADSKKAQVHVILHTDWYSISEF